MLRSDINTPESRAGACMVGVKYYKSKTTSVTYTFMRRGGQPNETEVVFLSRSLFG